MSAVVTGTSIKVAVASRLGRVFHRPAGAHLPKRVRPRRSAVKRRVAERDRGARNCRRRVFALEWLKAACDPVEDMGAVVR